MISAASGKHPPHSGAASLALRTEFYRQRMQQLLEENPDELSRLLELFQIESLEPVLNRNTYIVPVNLTYYPVRARENILSHIAVRLIDDLPERIIEELMTEGSMLLSGVDIDIRFGEPIEILGRLQCSPIHMDTLAKQGISFDDPIASRTRLLIEETKLTDRYMTDIYNQTTVNYDNLFASMLRAIRTKQIDKMDLRRRVFLTAVHIPTNTGLHLHRSLQEEQVHLLTDDRHGIINDFMKIALQKKIIKKKGNFLLKDRSKFSSPYDFHRARIDNPIEVSANAVEPLPELQKLVDRFASLPRFWIKKKIYRYFSQQAVEEYERDYRHFYISGETKPIGVGMPYIIKGKSKDVGIVLAHGYMAAPMEVKGLATYLGRLGFWVYVPRLKGHGTSPEDLATRSYLEWRDSVDKGYAIISNVCKRVVAGGFSIGAGLALDLAARVEQIAGVFAIAVPVRLKKLSTRFAPAVEFWNHLMERTRQPGAKREFAEYSPESPHIDYLRNPVSGVVEIERFMEDLAPKIPNIDVPLFVAQSSNDPIVAPKGSRKIYELTGSTEKEYRLYNYDRHGILMGDGSQKVHKAIGEFLKQF
jgi:esterase/lipase